MEDLEASSLVNVRDEMLSFCESGEIEVENVRGCGDFAWNEITKYSKYENIYYR